MVSFRVGAVAVALAAVALSYAVGLDRGRKQGALSAVDSVSHKVLAQRQELADSNQELNERFSALQADHQVQAETINQLKKDLLKSGHQNFEDKKELVLYRRIAGSSDKSGLIIDELEKTMTSENQLSGVRFSLLQYQGKENVSGTITISVTGETDGEPFIHGLNAVDAFSTVDFDLRFFETFELPMVVESAAGIKSIEFSINPAGDTQKPKKKVFKWGEIPAHRP